MSRTQNVSRNIVWGLINKVVLIVLPFLVRTVLLYKLGTQYLGLSSLFASVLSVLSLSELGFGQALVYSMYEPIAKSDTKRINALLKLYAKSYRIIGFVILVIGGILIPIIPKLIHGDVPSDVNVYILYVIYLLNTVVSYFLFAYKKSIFYAAQRVDLDININTKISIIQNLVQIGLVLVFQNYYIYIIVMPLATLLNNIWVSHSVNQKYPQYRPEGEIENSELKAIFKNVRGLIFQKIGGVVLLSVDNIVVSAFLGLEMVAIYNNYYYVVTALTGVLAIVMNSLKPSVGNSMVTESIEKNFVDFKKFNFLYLWIVSWCTITMSCLYQPFMSAWVGKALMLSNSMALLFALYFFINKWCDMLYVYQEAAGLWYENRYVPLIAAVFNLVLNLTLVQIIGLSGILLSTVIAILLIYNTGYSYILFKYYFKDLKLLKHYFAGQFKYVFVFLISGMVTYAVCTYIVLNDYLTVIVRGLICFVLPNIICAIILKKDENYIGIKMLIKKVMTQRGIVK